MDSSLDKVIAELREGYDLTVQKSNEPFMDIISLRELWTSYYNFLQVSFVIFLISGKPVPQELKDIAKKSKKRLKSYSLSNN